MKPETVPFSYGDAATSKKKPAYTLHKHSGQARVRIDGKDHYFGAFGSPESRERYNHLVADWFDRQGDITGCTLTIDDVALLYGCLFTIDSNVAFS